MTTELELDTLRAQAFAGKVLGFMNSTATALGISLGHRCGLFDVMATLPPATSDEIARATGLNERYVREWLAGMTVGGVVEYDAAGRQYRLPPEHAAAITRAAGPGNMAAFIQVLPMLAAVEDELVEAFRTGRGVPYSSFPKFTAHMAEESAQRFDHLLIDVQIPMVPGIVERLEQGIAVADLGCGAGRALNLMAKRWPRSTFTGYDIQENAIEAARSEADSWGLQKVQFEVADASRLPGEAAFDFVTTFDAVHDQADPAGLLQTIARLLRPGGVYLCVDVAASSDVAKNMEHPLAPFVYNASIYHCMSVSLAQGGAGLGAMWGEEKAIELLRDAGFADIDVKRVEGDILNNYYIARK